MKITLSTALLLILVFTACTKNHGDNNPVQPKGKFGKLNRITGPNIYDEVLLQGFNSDSTVFFYNDSNRVSTILYYGGYVQANQTQKFVAQENMFYDTAGRIAQMTINAPAALLLEKQVVFTYDRFNGDLIKAKVLLRSNGVISENDSIVITYIHIHAPYIGGSRFYDGEEIIDQIGATRTDYSASYTIGDYWMPSEYYWQLNKYNVPMEIRANTRNPGPITYFTHIYLQDSGIVRWEKYKDAVSQNTKTYSRSAIPDPNYLVSKNIFRNNVWLSGIGIFSPFHEQYTRSLITQSALGGGAISFSHTYKVDSVANTIIENAVETVPPTDSLKRTYYFSD